MLLVEELRWVLRVAESELDEFGSTIISGRTGMLLDKRWTDSLPSPCPEMVKFWPLLLMGRIRMAVILGLFKYIDL